MMVVASRSDNSLDKPRIISEIKKNGKRKPIAQNDGSNPRISGELDWCCGDQAHWELRHVEVRNGSLAVFSDSSLIPEFTIPLRHLNLQPAGRPRAFSLSRGHAQPVAVFQARNDHEYERWVTTLAVELMRQTPLDAIRFLDILGITATISPGRCGTMRRGASETSLLTANTSWDRPIEPVSSQPERGRARTRDIDNCQPQSDGSNSGHSDTELERMDEEEVAALILRCQQVDNYVPVREKRRLFESLCRRGRRLAQSTDNLFTEHAAAPSGGKVRPKKRARSLHDLSRCTRSSVAVSEICRYFEQRGQQQQQCRHATAECDNSYLSRRQLQRWERRLAKLKQQAADAEEKIWRIQDEMAVFDSRRQPNANSSDRSQILHQYSFLEKKLVEEEARLSHLQAEAGRVLKQVEVSSHKFESSLLQSSDELSNSRQ